MDEGGLGMQQSGSKPSTVEAERDYYRLVAERLGQKSLTDAQDFSRMIRNLRQTEEQLRKSQEELEKKIADRTSELVKSNRELRLSTSRYDELVQRIPHGVYTLCVESDGSMQFEYLSPQLCRILGLDAAAALQDARRALDIAHPEDADDLVSTTRNASRELKPYRWEGRFIVRGEVRWICIESDPLKTPEGSIVWSGVLSDITERKQTEEKLRESDQLYRHLTELGPNAITVVDLLGVIRMLNPKALQLFGFADESEAIGRAIMDRIAPECRETCRIATLELLRKGSVADLELRLLHNDGSGFSGDVNASLLCDSQGQPKLIIMVASDTTGRKQAEEERLKLQKMEAIGTLAGGLAHDFNNLLQGVFGYIALARLKLSDLEGAGAMLRQAEQAINQAVNLTSQLLTFSKGGEPQKKRVVLTKTIENAARFALSGSSSSCTLAIARDLWSTDADEGQIAQVIQNIVLNASQAMQQSGTVKIIADNIELPSHSAAALPEGGRFVRIQIADSGIGIPAQYLAKLFDPYFTTKQKGSGLGLATSYSIVKRHEGTIVVSSDSGTGTTFCVYLPAIAPQEEPQAAQAASPSAPAVAATRRGLVLVMDDEEMVRNVAVKMIELCGFEADCAADGREAIVKLREAREKGQPFDVVILDLTVKGGMGGEEAIGKIRETDDAVKAVVSTGYSDNPVVSNYRSYGFNAYLNKPYTFAALRDSLAALLAGS
jgi:two-component system, cell cycle sensor histidine kinase and response regulator CckA